MINKIVEQSISLKEHISEKDYKDINKLQELSRLADKVNLKLELDYKLNMTRHFEIGVKTINEFFYYVEGVLVAYLGISSFGGNAGEINGVTHPDWRRKGIFKKLFKLAMEECKKRNFSKVLLLTDGKSTSGVEFIKAMGGTYDFSEYRMELRNEGTSENINLITLKKAEKLDEKEIARQNGIFFYGLEEDEVLEEEQQLDENKNLDENTYMVKLKEETIGKIRVKYNEISAFISGFGILPSFRGKGYGKAALKAALEVIKENNINEAQLDVECKNSTALTLYKSCGFEEKSIMNYYAI